MRLLRLIFLLAVPAASWAQTADVSALTKKANAICAAQVVSIEAPNESRNTFLIHLKVDDGLRGIQTGEEVVISEWAGRWQAGVARWRVGESYLLFLANAKGSVSIVDGDAGRLRISKGMVAVDVAKSERAMRLQKTGAPPNQVPYREVADQIRLATREQR
jgi:hypothetical protein